MEKSKLRKKPKKSKEKKSYEFLYPILITTIAIFCYFTLIIAIYYIPSQMWKTKSSKIYSITVLSIFHIIFLLTAYTFFKTIFSNPGSPPTHWVK